MSNHKKDRYQFLIRFGYVGHRFHGIQPQPDVMTAGEALKQRLWKAAGEKPKGLVYAARTDASVSALANYSTCWYPTLDDEESFIKEVSSERDDGLLGVHMQRVPYNIHARGISQGKRYRYWVESGHPQERRDNLFVWQICPPMSKERLLNAANDFLGQHDFTSFRASGCSAGTPIKTMYRLNIGGPFQIDGPIQRWVFEFEGDAFLRKMIRIMVGTLVEIGTQWRPVDHIPHIIAEQHRSAAGVTAPACGLTLSQVGCTWPEDGSALVYATS
jgi:tRNA pseudouridine38-40 synthase